MKIRALFHIVITTLTLAVTSTVTHASNEATIANLQIPGCL